METDNRIEDLIKLYELMKKERDDYQKKLTELLLKLNMEDK